MRVVVTGGAGFLGSHLCEALLLDFNEICVIDDMFRGKQRNLETCKSSAIEMGIPFHIVMKDAGNPESYDIALRRLGGSVDVVYHLAAINGTRWFHERPDLVVKINHNTLEAALNFATSQGARFIFTSSPEAWGEQIEMPLNNSKSSIFTPPNIHQRHSYGASKYIGELLVHHAIRTNSIDARIVRPFNTYGPRLPGDTHGQVVSMLLEKCRSDEPMEIHGDGLQSRCFTWVEDVVRGIKLVGELETGLDGTNLTGKSFNLGSTIETTILELADICAQTSGSTIEPKMITSHPGDVIRRVPDISMSEQMLGWNAEVSLQDGIERTWAWMNNN
jgi:nucleoside-diphosphate-sugar epimerase